MLIRNSLTRWVLWILFAAVVLALLVSPLVMTLVLALAGEWTDVMPSGVTLGHLGEALSGDSLASFWVSIQTAIIASLSAVVLGTWGALAADAAPAWWAKPLSVLFHLPAALPSVVIGLGTLIAFSRPPLALNGTAAIVVIVQCLMVLSFTFSTVKGAMAGLDPQQRLVASALGASPARILWAITLPRLMPAIGAAAGLSVALCMGELGATVMVYPASWRTIPVSIFTAIDRGDLFLGSAMTALLVLVTVLILGLIGRIRWGTSGRASARRPR